MRSRSGRGFILHLSVCAALSAAVGCGFYYFSLNWFKEHKSDEKIIALRLVDAFVNNYSAIRAQFGQSAPVPASFRAKAIEAFNKQIGDNSDFRLRSVGRPGQRIVTSPTDARMAQTVEAFAATSNPKPVSELLEVDGQTMFRTVYPTLAQEQSCIDCHNALQPDKQQWHLNDVIGAFVIDVPISPFLFTVMWQSAGVGTGALSSRIGARRSDHFAHAFSSTGSARRVYCRSSSGLAAFSTRSSRTCPWPSP